ncbi:MAG: polyprenyl synthetase family protein [Deltaproteobacteria bacterium]|nr:polyprenyl synthetase family protein [Deltaproteobacteria bacterium]
MIKSLSVLKQISDEQGIDSATATAINDVSQLLEDALSDLELQLMTGLEEAPQPVSDITSYILDAGGKRIRPSMCILGAKAFSGTATPTDLAVVCELLHNATLLHDDVIDEGDRRRGKPSARMVWSNALSILGGDYMLMRCVEIMSLKPAIYMQRFVGTLKALVEGEIIQLKLRESVETRREDYFAIVKGKTSSLFGFAAFCGAMTGGASEEDVQEMTAFGENIGIAFQLIDDVLDFSSDAEVLGKNLLADISQGKMTLPVIMAAAQNRLVKNSLMRLTAGDESIDECAAAVADAVMRSNALESTRLEARRHTDLAMQSLERLSTANDAVTAILRQLALSLLQRGN